MHTRLTAISALLVLGLTVPTLAQEPVAPGTSLSERCAVNAPDETTLATCLDIVETVLAPEGENVRLVTVTSVEDFMAGMADVMPVEVDIDGTFRTSEEPTTRAKAPTRKQKREAARRQREMAGGFADAIRAYLLGVTHDPCYENMYASAWGLATALRLVAAGASTNPQTLLYNTYAPYAESPQAISCGELDLGE